MNEISPARALLDPGRLAVLKQVERKLLWLAIIFHPALCKISILSR